MKNINIESITIVLNDPRIFDSRLVIVSSAEGGMYGYISADGEKIFKADGNTAEEILDKVSVFCTNLLA